MSTHLSMQGTSHSRAPGMDVVLFVKLNLVFPNSVIESGISIRHSHMNEQAFECSRILPVSALGGVISSPVSRWSCLTEELKTRARQWRTKAT